MRVLLALSLLAVSGCDRCEDDDGDEICAEEDNCPEVSNPYQADAHGDGVGNACDDLDQATCDPETVTLLVFGEDLETATLTIPVEGCSCAAAEGMDSDPRGVSLKFDPLTTTIRLYTYITDLEITAVTPEPDAWTTSQATWEDLTAPLEVELDLDEEQDTGRHKLGFTFDPASHAVTDSWVACW